MELSQARGVGSEEEEGSLVLGSVPVSCSYNCSVFYPRTELVDV